MHPDRLRELFRMQLDLQREAYGKDFTALDPEARAQEVKDNVLALQDELHEALGEVGWKPWAYSRHLNEEAFRGELVDALHFFLNLYALAGGDADDLFARYRRKNQRNLERQLEGYDGVTGKCPICLRALDDPGVSCRKTMGSDGETHHYCGQF